MCAECRERGSQEEYMRRKYKEEIKEEDLKQLSNEGLKEEAEKRGIP